MHDTSVLSPEIQAVETPEALAALEPDWQALHARDPEADMFLSPRWLVPVMTQRPGRWVVLSARRGDGTLIGVLPLWRMPFRHRETGALRIELMGAGRMAWSEYCGFVCAPGSERRALTGFAHWLEGRDWATLSLPYVVQQGRAETFAAAFDPDGFIVEWPDRRINNGNVDSHRCPRVELPADFETYLTDCLSPRTRQKLRRLQRRYLGTGPFGISNATDSSFADDLDEAMSHWQRKWTAPDRTIDRYREIFHAAHARGQLTMPILRDRGSFVGALVILGEGRYRLFKLAARDATRSDLPVGMLLHAHAIRTAIAEGAGIYDFGHGDEPYKYGFGANDVQARTLRISRG